MSRPAGDLRKLVQIGIPRSRVDSFSILAPRLVGHPGSGNRRAYSEEDVRRLVLANELVKARFGTNRAQEVVLSQMGSARAGVWAITPAGDAFVVDDLAADVRRHGALFVMNVGRVLGRAMEIWRS